MADTTQTPTAQDSLASRQIRVFLSSTFRDFMEERDLLVKQVFPSLRRRAQERGVEVVDVDLRWGVTQEESEQGKVIGICLAEIERCRPYFIGMLGERYGWTPERTDYPDELFEREQLGWIRDHQGNASVTELEILHGVLNDKEMAGRAFFYFRDQAWSRAQSEPGFVCDTPEEEAKLAALKDRIRASGFPVAQDLPDPKAIADQIEADLWALIEEQYPDLDQADALEKEARKHASYRQSRLGVYLGQEYVDQLEALVHGGAKKILITGESGSGKSALIANWMHQHERENPGDVVYAHHLGCSNDANAIRPLLDRMLNTASKLLNEAELITQPIQVPEDWWELTAKVAETLQDLGRWCRKTAKRWIWVLDGLDRLADDDQQALPWLPLLIPEGVSVVISALECQAKAIMQERQFQLLEIGPLRRNEQEQLIDCYLGRYTKKLDADRVEQILASPLAQSPLFLRVLLEELRQCGRFETLREQIEDYIKPKADGSLAVNDLYGRVLARLERDIGHEPVQKALTALWASRAGLSESDLLAITGLVPLQWAPIDLALVQAFGRNGNRLVFDHDYLRRAVDERYLNSEEESRKAHSDLADWFQTQEEWNARKAEEWPWQLLQADRKADLRALLLNVNQLFELAKERNERETINYWLTVEGLGDGELDELILEDLEKEIARRRDNAPDLICFVDQIAELFDEAGLYREPLLKLRALSLELEEASDERSEESILSSLALLAGAYHDLGQYDAALPMYQRCLEAREKLLGSEHSDTLSTVANLGMLHRSKGDFELAEAFLSRCLEAREKILGPKHPATLTTINNLALVYDDKGESMRAKEYYLRCLAIKEDVLGQTHESTLSTVNNLGLLYITLGKNDQACALLTRCLEARIDLLGAQHPKTLITLNNLGLLYSEMGNHENAEASYVRSLQGRERILGAEHPDTLTAVSNLAALFQVRGEYQQALLLLKRALESRERLLGPVHPDTIKTRDRMINLLSKCELHGEAIVLSQHAYKVIVAAYGESHLESLKQLGNQASLHEELGELEKAEALFKICLEGRERILGRDDPDTLDIAYLLADILSQQGRYSEAIPLRKRELAQCRQTNGDRDPGTLHSINSLAIDLRETGELHESEILFRELVVACQEVLEPEDFQIGRSLGGLAKTLEAAGKLEEALTYSQRTLDHRLAHEGHDDWWTNLNRLDLARVLHKLDRSAEALSLLDQLHESLAKLEKPDKDDQKLIVDAKELQKSIRSDDQ